ncbi:waprin-Thr1-like isoform X1 [Pimephales promelas]|uniref:waprin-Thr1-like isoform X1 n=1 Tax=Pimephales promelas TaxID=90988 RepID=UPI001955B5A6|nr:waprin-Thr1-like isoform X1 [Pimephales promelas]
MTTVRVYCSLSAVLLCLSACLNTIEAGVVAAKPGQCPIRSSAVGLCDDVCSNDSDCPNDEKCCISGCGYQCMAPYTAEPLTPAADPQNHPVTSAAKTQNPPVCVENGRHPHANGECLTPMVRMG